VGQIALEVAHHRVHAQMRIVPEEPGRAALEGQAVHVQGHVAHRTAARAHRVEDPARLLRRPGPDLHDVVGKNLPDQLGNNFLEQGRLGPGRIVLRQLGDALE